MTRWRQYSQLRANFMVIFFFADVDHILSSWVVPCREWKDEEH